jgi:hypothetical protein
MRFFPVPLYLRARCHASNTEMCIVAMTETPWNTSFNSVKVMLNEL